MTETYKGIIYTRVSSRRQETEGHGLESQYAICLQYARKKGIAIECHFSDTLTGRKSDRAGINSLIAHVRRHRRIQWIIIFDDISRFARDLKDHLELREKLRAAGCVVATPSKEFKDDPDSLLIENILASISQHSSMKNTETVMSRMAGCLYSGRWPFRLPYGYMRAEARGASDAIRCEPHFSIIAEAFRRFASRSLVNQAAVRDFFADQPSYKLHHGEAKARIQRVSRVLTNVFYAGYIEYPRWGVPLLEGNHEAAVDYETFCEVQRILSSGRKVAPTPRAVDFPARGLVSCAECEGHLTSAWSKGKLKKYPYYKCTNRACVSYGKSIPRSDVEDGIALLLKQVSPVEGALEVFRNFVLEAAELRHRSVRLRQQELRKAISSNEERESQLIDRFLEVTEKRVVEKLQQRLIALSREGELLRVKLKEADTANASEQRQFEHLSQILASPCDAWLNGGSRQKKAVVTACFSSKLRYARGRGFRTPSLRPIFKALLYANDGASVLVEPRGVEPLTSTMPL